MAEFRITLTCVWNKDGKFEILHKADAGELVNELVDDSDDEMEAD